MDISIIIPAYNEEKNLPIIIKALRSQKPKNFEIIVVDNNSSDRTFKVAKKLADKVYKCKEQGISPARNFGAKKSSKEIIAFLDADSIPPSTWISEINRVFEKDKNLTMVSGVDFYESNNFLRKTAMNLFSLIIAINNKVLSLFNVPILIANNFAIKRKVFAKVGGFDNLVVEDYYLALKLKKLGGVKGIINFNLKVILSGRRFDKLGVFKTIKDWTVPLLKKVPSNQYKLHDKL